MGLSLAGETHLSLELGVERTDAVPRGLDVGCKPGGGGFFTFQQCTAGVETLQLHRWGAQAGRHGKKFLPHSRVTTNTITETFFDLQALPPAQKF